MWCGNKTQVNMDTSESLPLQHKTSLTAFTDQVGLYTWYRSLYQVYKKKEACPIFVSTSKLVRKRLFFCTLPFHFDGEMIRPSKWYVGASTEDVKE